MIHFVYAAPSLSRFKSLQGNQRLSECSPRRGMTLIEVLIAMFILFVGVLGVLAALPTGVEAASWITLQDAAINLSSSKFAEFRRDRVNPDQMSAYLTSAFGSADAEGYRSFPHGPGDPFEFYADIERYEWKVETTRMGLSPRKTSSDGNRYYYAPVAGGDLELWGVLVVIRQKGAQRSFRFTQHMTNWQ
jgi:type II secretory pathway pseudopilin PulG